MTDDDAGIVQAAAAGDRLLEHRVRLAICVLLARRDALSFRRLKILTGETDGALGAHLGRLEKAGYLRVRKAFRERKPVTWYALTTAGKQALRSHVQALRQVLSGLRDV